MDVDWQLEEIYVGDNRGNLMIFDTKTGRMKHSVPISGFKISSIAVSLNYVAITQSTGHTAVFDKNNNFEVSIKLEESYVEQDMQTKCYKGVRLLETDKEIMFKKATEISKNSSIFILNRVSQLSQVNLDNTQASLTKEINARKTSSIKAITVHNLSTLRLHQIHKSHNALTSVSLVNYFLDGKIMDMQVHPSNDYLVVLASDGTVSIFKIANGNLKGRIEVNKFSRKITIDPSGLYVVVVSPAPFSKGSTGDQADQYNRSFGRDSLTSLLKSGNGKSGGDDLNPRPQLGTQYNTEQSIVSIYEIGTGDFVGEVSKVSTATSLSFSSDGSFVVIGCHKGLMVVLGIDPGLRENIFEALDGIRKNPYFWNDYPFMFNGKAKVKGNILSGEETRKDRRESNKMIQSELFDSQITPRQAGPTAQVQPKVDKFASTDPGSRNPSTSQKQSIFAETQPLIKSAKHFQNTHSYIPKVISPRTGLHRTQELANPAEKAVGKMTSPYIQTEPQRIENNSPINPDVKDANVNTSFKIEKPSPRPGQKKNTYKQTLPGGKEEVIQSQKINPYQSNNQNILPYQQKPSFTPKIYKDVIQQTSFLRGTESDSSYDSKLKEHQQNSLHFQNADSRKNAAQRNIRPDPVDIDDEEMPGQLKPDPEDIDNSDGNYQERQPYKYYEERPYQQEFPEHADNAYEQDAIKPRPNFLNKDPKEAQRSYSELNEGGPSEVFDQISEFERKFARPNQDISDHSNF